VDLGDRQVHLPYGAVLPFYTNGTILFLGQRVPVNAVTNTLDGGERAELVETYMHPFLGAPYLWGGRTPWGVDCSGFTQMIFMFMGIYLPRDAAQQAEEGDPVQPLELAEPGDLAFFDNDEGRIIHVGIILGDRRIVHASGRVRIDTLDQEGIFNAEEKRYSHHLRLVKRVL
jgi:gamma-D-glutamyl-L-lysine dipeptidyl-peptidase